KLFNYAVNLALNNDIHVILTDTFALNKRAQGLFKKFDFTKVGEVNIDYPPFDKGEPFYAYYKNLEEKREYYDKIGIHRLGHFWTCFINSKFDTNSFIW